MAGISTCDHLASSYILLLFEVMQRLQSWRINIATKALEVVGTWIKNSRDDMEQIIVKSEGRLTMKDVIADQIVAHFQKRPIHHLHAGIELYTYAYQWAEWNGGVGSRVR
jgi:hypothetical protein